MFTLYFLNFFVDLFFPLLLVSFCFWQLQRMENVAEGREDIIHLNISILQEKKELFQAFYDFM